jgi:hypothetical protein
VTTVDEDLAALRERWGATHLIWYVPLLLGGYTWCGRRHGDPLRDVIHADSPVHSGEYLTEAEADRGSAAP